jgi:hypothetical protein
MIFFSAPIVSLVILGTWWTVFLAFLILFIDIDFTEMLGDKANEFTNMVGKALPLIQIFLMEAF